MKHCESFAWIVATIAILWLLLVRGCFDMDAPVKTQGRAFAVAKTDTVVKFVVDTVVVRRDRIRIRHAAARIDTLRDTLLQDVPFIASLDTVAQGDTITIRFSFPEKRFSLNVASKPDSILTQTKIVTVTETVMVEPSFMEKVGYGTVGFLIGSGVGIGVGIYIAR